jgi:polyhydroxyalkanoate synthesis regulator phasin
MIFRKDNNTEIRKTSLDLHDLFMQLGMDNAKFIVRSTPVLEVTIPEAKVEIDLKKLAEEPYIRAEKGLVDEGGVSEEEAKKIKDGLMAQHETRAFEYLKKRPEVEEAVQYFVLKVQEIDKSKKPMVSYWNVLSWLTEAIRCYVTKNEPKSSEVARDVFSRAFYREIEKIKPNWPTTPQGVKNEMASLLVKGYNGHEKIIQEVLGYLK